MTILVEFGVALTHVMWSGTWWLVGHTLYLIVRGCTDARTKECNFMNYATEDFLAALFFFIGSMVYCYIGHRVIKAVYGGQLPDGTPISNMQKIMKNFMNTQQQQTQTPHYKKYKK